MAKQAEFLTFVYLNILLLTVVNGEIIQMPLNVATSVGEETGINCSSNTGVITWIYTTDCNSGVGTVLTDDNCDITSNHVSHYRTEKPGGLVCNLVVFDALLAHGGCYICGDGLGPGRQSGAFLIVVDSNAIFNDNSTDAIAGDSIIISNSVSYGGPLLQPLILPPSFYWALESNHSQNVTSYPASTTTSSASSYIVVTVQPPNVPPYICNLFFNPPANVPEGCASNAPTYHTSWETPAYNVSHNTAPNVTATPHFESDICEAKILSCQPNAYPPAETYWMDTQKNANIYHQSITAEYMDEYVCVATNFYTNASHQATTTYSLSDQGQFSQTPCQFAESSKVEIILPANAQCDNFTCTCSCCNDAVLKCSAQTLPEAEYKWLFGDTETEGSTIKPTEDGNYTCIAYNTVNNQRFNGNKSISISKFYEYLPNSPPATDETVVIVLSALLAFFILVVIGLVSWIFIWILPKMRSLQASISSRDDNCTRQAAYESVVKPSAETSPYESLQQPTASAYQDVSL